MNQTKQQNTRAHFSQAQSVSSKSPPTPHNQPLTADQLLKKLKDLGATASFLKATRKTLAG